MGKNVSVQMHQNIFQWWDFKASLWLSKCDFCWQLKECWMKGADIVSPLKGWLAFPNNAHFRYWTQKHICICWYLYTMSIFIILDPKKLYKFLQCLGKWFFLSIYVYRIFLYAWDLRWSRSAINKIVAVSVIQPDKHHHCPGKNISNKYSNIFPEYFISRNISAIW